MSNINRNNNIIFDDNIDKVSLSLKGVTYFDRQDNLKKLYEAHLNKEDKHLVLEKYYVGRTQTFRVMFNGLDVGTIPEEYFGMFFSKDYEYNLSNIHIGDFQADNGKTIYWAKLFVVFTRKERNEILQEKNNVQPDPKEEEIVKEANPVALQNKETNERLLQKEKKQTDLITNLNAGKPNYKSENTATTKSGCSEIMTISGCVFMFFIFSLLAFNESPLYFLGSAFCILGIVIFSKDIKKIFNEEKPDNSTPPDIKKMYLAGEHNNTTQEEADVINKYRLADDNVREEVLMILSLEPNPEKKKKKYYCYSMHEAKIILTFRNSTKAVRNKVIEKLGL